MPVAGTKQYQDDQQQEAEGQPCGQGAGCSDVGGTVRGRPALLTVAVSIAVADPMPMAFASTFLCSQEIHGLALMVDAYQTRATGRARQSQEGLGHIVAQVQAYPAAVQLQPGPIGFQHLPVQILG